MRQALYLWREAKWKSVAIHSQSSLPTGIIIFRLCILCIIRSISTIPNLLTALPRKQRQSTVHKLCVDGRARPSTVYWPDSHTYRQAELRLSSSNRWDRPRGCKPDQGNWRRVNAAVTAQTSAARVHSDGTPTNNSSNVLVKLVAHFAHRR